MTTLHFQIHIPEHDNTELPHMTTPTSSVDATTRDVAQRITSAQREFSHTPKPLNHHSPQ